jgi:hypothetical protein
MKKTYREHLQKLIRQIWNDYDTTGGLRDSASLEQKKYWNEARGKLYEAAIVLGKLDDSLTMQEASQKI